MDDCKQTLEEASDVSRFLRQSFRTNAPIPVCSSEAGEYLMNYGVLYRLATQLTDRLNRLSEAEMASSVLQKKINNDLKREIDTIRKCTLFPDATDSKIISHVFLPEDAIRRLELAQRIRQAFKLTAAVAMAGDWQSPPISQSLGRATTIGSAELGPLGFDYKRYNHLSAQRFENEFVAHYLPDFEDRLVARVTCSGMAALSTMAAYLSNRFADDSPVFFASNAYHENRYIVQKIFSTRASPLKLGSDTRPCKSASILFFDTVSNTRFIAVSNLEKIFKASRSFVGANGLFVIDDTMVGDSQGLFSLAEKHGLLDRVVVIQSLAKLHQAGMDVTTGGIMLYSKSLEQNTDSPTTFRTHLGTQLPDFSTWTLPSPQRAITEERMQRIGRNVEYLARELEEFRSTANSSSPLDRVVHPSLNNERLPFPTWGGAFTTGCLNLIFKDRLDCDLIYQKFIGLVVEEACRHQIPLFSGTSFGFDFTRVYHIESRVPEFQSFLRISPGTETGDEMRRLLQVFVTSLERLTVEFKN